MRMESVSRQHSTRAFWDARFVGGRGGRCIVAHARSAALAVSIVGSLTACATSESAARAAQPSQLQDVACRYVGLEDVSGPSDQNADQVSLVATYRFGEGVSAPTKAPLPLKFQVSRSRVSELTAYLSASPEVICVPEGDSNYTAKVAPFGDVRGEPQR
jgi:hypothetical protein